MNETITAPIQQKKDKRLSYNDEQDSILISWIIIGRDWSSTSALLVESLNKQNINSQIVQLIIIDDGSDDKSINKLNNIECENKKIIKINKQSGRCYARNHGINLAVGKFCLFTNGNIIPETDFLNKYIKFLSQLDIDGAAGIINYQSADNKFEQYLNNNKRGLKQFKEGHLLPIEHVLFGNCAIKTKLLKKINGFNEQLMGYGGEELEILSRMEHLKDLTIIKIDANVIRPNHPGLYEHCNRLRQFGRTNFKNLPTQIQKKIIPDLILKKYKFIPTILMLLKIKVLNEIFRGKSFILVRSLMGLSILRGYKS